MPPNKRYIVTRRADGRYLTTHERTRFVAAPHRYRAVAWLHARYLERFGWA